MHNLCGLHLSSRCARRPTMPPDRDVAMRRCRCGRRGRMRAAGPAGGAVGTPAAAGANCAAARSGSQGAYWLLLRRRRRRLRPPAGCRAGTAAAGRRPGSRSTQDCCLHCHRPAAWHLLLRIPHWRRRHHDWSSSPPYLQSAHVCCSCHRHRHCSAATWVAAQLPLGSLQAMGWRCLALRPQRGAPAPSSRRAAACGRPAAAGGLLWRLCAPPADVANRQHCCCPSNVAERPGCCHHGLPPAAACCSAASEAGLYAAAAW